MENKTIDALVQRIDGARTWQGSGSISGRCTVLWKLLGGDLCRWGAAARPEAQNLSLFKVSCRLCVERDQTLCQRLLRLLEQVLLHRRIPRGGEPGQLGSAGSSMAMTGMPPQSGTTCWPAPQLPIDAWQHAPSWGLCCISTQCLACPRASPPAETVALPAGRRPACPQELQFPGDNFHSGFWPAFWLMVRPKAAAASAARSSLPAVTGCRQECNAMLP